MELVKSNWPFKLIYNNYLFIFIHSKLTAQYPSRFLPMQSTPVNIFSSDIQQPPSNF